MGAINFVPALLGCGRLRGRVRAAFGACFHAHRFALCVLVGVGLYDSGPPPSVRRLTCNSVSVAPRFTQRRCDAILADATVECLESSEQCQHDGGHQHRQSRARQSAHRPGRRQKVRHPFNSYFVLLSRAVCRRDAMKVRLEIAFLNHLFVFFHWTGRDPSASPARR